MQKELSLLLCCLTVVSCLGAGAQESFDSAYQDGLEKMQTREWAAARDRFGKALAGTADRGRKADAELQIGRCFQAEGKSVEAMKSFVNSMRWRYYFASSIRYGPWLNARGEYRRILEVPVTRETAETVIFKALAEIGLAQQWRRERDTSQAEAHYRRALEWLGAPQYSNKVIQRRDLRSAYLGLAEVCAGRQDYEAAQDALRQLLAVPGARSRRSVQQRLWALCRLVGSCEEMRDNAHKIVVAPEAGPADRIDAQFEIAYSYIAERRFKVARTEFARVLTMAGTTPPQRSEAQLYIAHTFFVARKYTEARPLYERVLRMDNAGPLHKATARARMKAIDALANK